MALSMLLTPLLFILYERVIAPRFAQDQNRDADVITEPGKILVLGHGRFGGIVARMLRALDKSVTVVDHSSKQLEMLRAFGVQAYFGDATRPDLLHSAGLADAKVVVVAIDGKDQITEIVDYIAKNYPNVHIVARAFDRFHVFDLYQAGADDIIRETFDSGVRSGRSVYEALGLSRDEAEALAKCFTLFDQKHMRGMAEAHRRDTPPHLNEAMIAAGRDMTEELHAEMKALRDRLVAARGAQGNGVAADATPAPANAPDAAGIPAPQA